MITLLLAKLVTPQVLLALQTAIPADSSSDSTWWILLAGPAAGVGVYTSIYLYYRNTDKSHSFETETRVAYRPINGSDNKVDEIRGTTRGAIPGNNVNSPRVRVNRVQ